MVPPPSEEMALFVVLPFQVMALSLALPLVAPVGPEGGQKNMEKDTLELPTINLLELRIKDFKQNELEYNT